jgi:hypothetical protein
MYEGHRLGIPEFRLSTRLVQSFMAVDAQGNQIRIVIRALLAAQLFVMDVQVLSGAAVLTLPSIATQHLFSQLIAQLRIKPQASSLVSNAVHEAFSVKLWRKACRCSPGRNLKKRDMDCRSTVGSSWSRFAPARKSAQIISRQ